MEGSVEIPKCKYSGLPCHYEKHKKAYATVSPEYYKYIKHDSHVKCPWLNYESLFDAGLSIEDVESLSVELKRVRLFFVDVEFGESLITHLIKDNFTQEKVLELFEEINIQNREGVINFIKEIYKIKKIRNYEFQYWTYRGYNKREAKQHYDSFFKAGSVATSIKRKNNPQYNEDYILSRKNGGRASHLVNRNNNVSKVENELYDILSKKYTVSTKYYSPCKNAELSQLYNKANFLHDFIINDKYILEYNGIYWHKDFLSFNRFTKEEYLFEIKKAHNCIYEVKRNNNPNYIIVWENDFATIPDIINFIDNIIDEDDTSMFYSSRDIDLDFFADYRKKYLKDKQNDEKFKDIVLRLAEDSHCESIKVSAIAVKNGRITATGINGTVSGFINCDDYFSAMHKSEQIKIPYDEWKNTDEWKKLHHTWSNENELHAEQSLICEAARTGIGLQDSTIYVTHQPCAQCTKLLTSIGIKNIHYIKPYSKASEYSKYLLNTSGIIIKQI